MWCSCKQCQWKQSETLGGGGTYLFDVPFEVHVHTLSCFAIVSLHVFSSKPQECVHTHIQTSLRLLRTNTNKMAKEDDNNAAQHISSPLNVDLDVSLMSVFMWETRCYFFILISPKKYNTKKMTSAANQLYQVLKDFTLKCFGRIDVFLLQEFLVNTGGRSLRGTVPLNGRVSPAV